MNWTEWLVSEALTSTVPPLRQPKAEIADRGTVRLGDGCITAEFPQRR